MAKLLSGDTHNTHAVNLPEQGSTPATPAAGRWKSYFTSSGQYFLDSAGVVSYIFNDRYHLYPASDGFYYVGSRALRMAGVTAYQGEFTYDDSATDTVTNVLTLGHNSSGTPAASFGTGIIFEGETTTTVDTSMARVRSIWTTATHGSRAGSLILSVFDASAERDAITITTSGTAAAISQAATTIGIPTASLIPLTVKSTDDSTTNPVLRGRDSSDGLRWSVNYEGTGVWGRTTGGTNNGNIVLNMSDSFPSIRWRSATSIAGELFVDVTTSHFFYQTVQLNIRTLANAAKFSFNTTTGIANFGQVGTAATTLHVSEDLASTNAVGNQATLYTGSTGTPAAGHGVGQRFNAESSTTANREQGRIRTAWITATDASRAARMTLSAYDTAERDCLMIEASGSAAMIGFLGTAPTIKQTGYTTFTNLSTDRTCDADTVVVAELADIVGTLIEDLKAKGLIGA